MRINDQFLRRWISRANASLICVSTLILFSGPVQALPLYEGNLPQAYSNTCQSQSLMLALAIENDPAFSLSTPQELRAAEIEFRGLLKTISSSKSDLSTESHTTWKIAVETYTQEKYTLRLEYVEDPIEWAQSIAKITGNRVTPGTSVLTQFHGPKRAVMTSVESFDGNSHYGSGHIITVIGVDDSSKKSSDSSGSEHFLVAFNGGIQIAQQRVMCGLGEMPGDEKYSAGVVGTSTYSPKSFDGKRLLMWLEKR